jgi:hypothetical protein
LRTELDLGRLGLGNVRTRYALSGNDECAGVVFQEEEEALVFLPHSGEVLICSAEAWLEASKSGFLGKFHQITSPSLSQDAEALLATLDRLGVDLG